MSAKGSVTGRGRSMGGALRGARVKAATDRNRATGGGARARALRVALAALAASASAATLGTVADAAVATTHRFAPVADAHVDSSAPSASYPTATAMWVDGSPRKEIFLRFDVAGVGTGVVERATLRLYQKDSAPTGGEVVGVSSVTWGEAITWNTRPAADGLSAGSFGAVAAKSWYELDVSRLVTGDGPVSLAIRMSSADGARWQSRESTTPPSLIVDVGPAPTTTTAAPTTTTTAPTTTTTSAPTTTTTSAPTTTTTTSAPTTTTTTTTPPTDESITAVASSTEGSTTPTLGAAQHRSARTAGGRLLALWGRHSSGIQLSWRDAGGAWSRVTRGATSAGGILTGTGTGDWPASIAVARSADGVEHAWVVWAGRRSSNTAPLYVTRLSDLDSAAGPIVGPPIELDATPGFRADVSVERDGDVSRLALIWTRPNGSAFEVVTGWITDLGTDAPLLSDTTVLLSNPVASRYGTLVSTPAGVRAVLRAASGKLQVWRHDVGTARTSWSAATPSVLVVDEPVATSLADGTLLATTESDAANDVVSVQHLSSAGAPQAVELQAAGYRQPTITSDGTRAWLVMVRVSDGAVVSRERTPAGWSSDRVELLGSAGPYTWPNAIRSGDRLTLLVGKTTTELSNRSSVLAIDRAP
jgi:hypothetical protein